jgi:hypothetical protein
MLKIANLILDKRSTLVIILWLATFSVGMAVPSSPFRNRLVEYGTSFGPAKAAGENKTTPSSPGFWVVVLGLANPPSTKAKAIESNLGYWGALGCLLVVFISFTPTNTAILCILGSMLGAKAKADGHLDHPDAETANGGAVSAVGVASPSLNGLCVFLALLAGQIVVQGDLKWDDAAPNMYFRLAATATLFSVMAGTNPHFLSDLARYFSLPTRPKAGNETEVLSLPTRKHPRQSHRKAA